MPLPLAHGKNCVAAQWRRGTVLRDQCQLRVSGALQLRRRVCRIRCLGNRRIRPESTLETPSRDDARQASHSSGGRGRWTVLLQRNRNDDWRGKSNTLVGCHSADWFTDTGRSRRRLGRGGDVRSNGHTQCRWHDSADSAARAQRLVLDRNDAGTCDLNSRLQFWRCLRTVFSDGNRGITVSHQPCDVSSLENGERRKGGLPGSRGDDPGGERISAHGPVNRWSRRLPAGRFLPSVGIDVKRDHARQ